MPCWWGSKHLYMVACYLPVWYGYAHANGDGRGACVMYVHLGFLAFFQGYLVVFIRTIIRKNPIHQLNKIKKKYRKGLVKSNVRKFGSSSNSGTQKSHWKGNVSARTALYNFSFELSHRFGFHPDRNQDNFMLHYGQNTEKKALLSSLYNADTKNRNLQTNT